MAGLLYNFDSPFSFREDEYFFCYKDVVFKLKDGGQSYQHYLMSLVPEIVYPNGTDKIALEFLACLAFDAHMPVIYQSGIGNSGYNEALFNSPVRLSKSGRHIPLEEVNHPFPKELPNLTNQRKRHVLSMYQESLISGRTLPHYAFLGYWKILTIIENTENPTDKIWNSLGSDFFRKIGHLYEDDAKRYLKEDLRDRIGHALGRGKRHVFIMDPEIHIELNQLNDELDRLVRIGMRAFFSDRPPLHLFQIGTNIPTFMTEEEYFKRIR